MKTPSRPFPGWLEQAIFYEIYPQSFADSNGDGVGDLRGIIGKLPYLESLGVNALWLNPCFVSPFRDAGYDISDYYRVAPRYGTNADLTALFRAAHSRGMKVCLDLVAGHTSVEHPWFTASANDAKSATKDWYIWTDNIWNLAPAPLLSVQGPYDRDGAYVANFFSFQPALNYGFARPDPALPWQCGADHSAGRAVRAEMLKIMRFWLDAGCDGFRVDMAFGLIKQDPGYRETMKLWQEWRAIFDRDYPEKVLIAEWSSPRHALRAGFHLDFLIHFNSTAYNSLTRHEPARDVFRNRAYHGHSYLDRSGRGDITEFLREYLRQLDATSGLGFIAVPTGNHDLSRLNLDRSPEELKVALTLFLTLPGVPYLYYGDEIGMRHLSGLKSKEGGFGRTGARSPMQWNRSRNAGFSTAAKSALYLPIDPEPDRPNVAGQEGDSQSLLNHTRALVALRKSSRALSARGKISVIHAQRRHPVFVYQRQLGRECWLIALNPAARSFKIKIRLAGRAKVLAPVLQSQGVALYSDLPATWLQMPAISFGIFRAS